MNYFDCLSMSLTETNHRTKQTLIIASYMYCTHSYKRARIMYTNYRKRNRLK